MEKKWCMCCALDVVARDMDSTCSKCGGKDAYGTSKDRPENKHKVLYSETKKNTAPNTTYGILPSLEAVREEAAKFIEGDAVVTAVYDIIKHLGNFA